jgi:isoprenylcysteine carboxyl methyltransferase (ICMT) family protein YpbQ
MTDPTTLLHGYLVLLAAERAVELGVSGRNARRTLADGGVEVGRGRTTGGGP